MDSQTQKSTPKNRSIAVVYILGIITLGIYFIYWIVSTKGEIKNMGADIPTAWLLIIPIANLYFYYKYCEGFAKFVKKDNNGLLYFIVFALIGIIMPAIIQSGLNDVASGKA
jgi:hypothetical protein